MPIENTTKPITRYRREEASRYLKETWGLSYSPRTLAKLAVVGGSPQMQYAGRFPLYPKDALDLWAAAKIAPPVGRRTTSPAGRAIRGRAGSVALERPRPREARFG